MRLFNGIRPALAALVVLIPLISGCKEDVLHPAILDPDKNTAKIEAAVTASPLADKAKRVADRQSQMNRGDEKQVDSLENPQ